MAWIYLAELEAVTTPWHHGCAHEPIANATSRRKQSYLNANAAEKLQLLQSGPTYELSPADIFRARLTSSPEVSHARTSVLRELELAWKASEADFSSRSFDCVANYDPDSCSWKTCQQSLLGAEYESLPSLPASGMTLDGRLYQPLKLVPRTSEDGGSYLPTPTTDERDVKYKQGGTNLRAAVKTLWPTARASDGDKQNQYQGKGDRKWLTLTGAAKRYPTPRARDWKDGLTPARHGRHSPSVAVAVAEDGHKGYLNPQFVEVLMGFPVGATESRDWGTRGCLYKQGRHS